MTRAALLAVSALVLGAGCSCDLFESGDVDAGPSDGGVGDPCTDDVNCRAALTCDPTGVCAPSGDGPEGSICALTGDCAEGLYCGPARTCAPAGAGDDGADCQSTADCAPGLLCSLEGFGYRCRPAGEGDLGDECEDDRSCLAGLRCVLEGTRTCQDPPPAFAGDGGVPDTPPVLPRWAGESCDMDPGAPTAYFQIPRGGASDGDFYRLPFPNDVRRTGGGLDLSGHPAPGTALDVDVLGRHIAAAEEDLDGFATNPVIYFRFSRPNEWADVTPERVLLVDLDPDSPEFGRNIGRGWLTTAGQITRYICPNWLAIRRGHGSPLRAGGTYAAILLSGIRTSADEGSERFTRSADLDALLSSTAPTAEPLASAWPAYQPLRDWLGTGENPTEAQVLNATVFTTQDPTAMVRNLRDAIRAAAAPTVSDLTVCADGVTSPCDDGGARACGPESDAYWEVHARIALPQFQAGTPPFEEPEDGGGIAVDGSGAPQIQRDEPVCMVMTIPKVTAAPAGGFPLVIYGHGTGGAFTAPVANGLAAEFAAAPSEAVTIGFDLPQHGSRRGGSTRDPDVLVFNFVNPRAARDNFLQGAADLMSLVHWAEGYTLAAASSPSGFDVTFDPSRVVLFGHSQGATHGGLMLPFEPGIAAALLSGAGGDLTESLLTKTQPVNIAAAVPFALLDPDGAGGLAGGDHHPALALFQTFYERVDPVNFGRHYWREPIDDTGRHVFMTWGAGDSYSTERTMNALARSAFLAHVEPVVSDIGLGDPVAAPLSENVMVGGLPFTTGLRQYTPDAGDDGHFVALRTTAGRGDAVRFVQQALTGAAPAIGE